MRIPQGSDPVAERVAVSPERTAIVRAVDGASWTYGRLDDAVERTAGRLAALGVDAGDHVGLLAETGVPAVRTIYGALRLGAVPVPLNARLTAGELGPQLDAADVGLLVCEGETEALAIAAAKEAGDRVSTVATLGDSDANDDAPVRLAEQSTTGFETGTPDVDDPRLLLFTSGTTGDPKAVILTAGNLRASAIASAFRLGVHTSVASAVSGEQREPDARQTNGSDAGSSDERDESDGVEPGDRWFVPLAIYHMGGFAPIYRSVLYGTTAVLQRSFDAERTLDALDDRDATCLSVVPTMLRRLLDLDSAPGRLSDLRFVLSGGAATPRDLVERCADLDVPLCPTYGTTETGSQVATALPEEAREHEGTVGRPLFPTTVRIVDGDGDAAGAVGEGDAAGAVDERDAAGPVGDSLPAGEPGEIVVDGPTVSPGYYGNEAATVESRSELGYHTGDLGRRDGEGRLRVLGRADDAISTGGDLVHPAEVVEALESHPAIDAAAVVGLDDPEWGERVGALLVPTDDEVRPADVREHGEDRLAGYKRSRTVALVDELPRTASETVDREAVRERLRTDGVDF